MNINESNQFNHLEKLFQKIAEFILANYKHLKSFQPNSLSFCFVVDYQLR